MGIAHMTKERKKKKESKREREREIERQVDRKIERDKRENNEYKSFIRRGREKKTNGKRSYLFVKKKKWLRIAHIKKRNNDGRLFIYECVKQWKIKQTAPRVTTAGLALKNNQINIQKEKFFFFFFWFLSIKGERRLNKDKK